VEALDRNGRSFTVNGDELLAVAMQHEYDHLEGKLLIDQVSFLKKRMIRREMARLAVERGAASDAEAG
jgi:peptide deformylase